MKRIIQDILLSIVGLILIGPVQSIQIMRLGAQKAAAFRSMHHREPTKQEWIAISRQVYEEITQKQ